MSISEPRAAGFISRSSAGLVAPRSVSKNITPEHGGTLVHYGGADVPTSSHASAKSRWKSWQTYHMVTRGWVDIAYTMGVDNWGFVYAGRGAGVRTAANGTNYANQNYYAVCWIGGAKQTPTRAALSAIAWAVNALRDSGAGMSVGNHSDFRTTGCPGDDLRRETAKIDGKEFSSQDLLGGEQVIQRYDKGNGVRVFQSALLQWRGDALPKYGADSDFGPETEEWVKRYQNAAGVEVTGVIDGVTAALLARYAPANLQGVKGDKGDKGDRGPRGPKGDKGDVGELSGKTFTATVK